MFVMQCCSTSVTSFAVSHFCKTTCLLLIVSSEMWKSVLKRFMIAQPSVAKMRVYLTEHMAAVAQDNLQGQCTKGHSCKNSSLFILKQLVDEHASANATDRATDDAVGSATA